MIGQMNEQNYFVIEDKLPSLNDYINACRTNQYKGAKLKKDVESLISAYILVAKSKRTLTPTDKPIVVHFEWHEKTKRRDADNVVSAKSISLMQCKHQASFQTIAENMLKVLPTKSLTI